MLAAGDISIEPFNSFVRFHCKKNTATQPSPPIVKVPKTQARNLLTGISGARSTGTNASQPRTAITAKHGIARRANVW